MKKQKFKLPIKIILILAIILLAIFFIIGYILQALTTSDFFVIKQVGVRNSGAAFDYLKGKDIFSLDLRLESQKALANCPDCRRVRFVRLLPNCIFVDFVKRLPVALAKFYKNFAIDEQGVFFYSSPAIEESGLPVIYGLETKIFGPKPGIKYSRAEIDLALNIIKEFKASKTFQGFTLKRIDVASVQSAGFFLLLPKQAVDYARVNPRAEWSGFQVFIGENNIREKMMVLGGLVMQASGDWANIKYIDLRFKEPVIKLN
ncbi:MAG: hypothetical protein Q8K15_02330 [Candidatus Omnitrophota bacterium]|nr:hypothetical protein [Candidatus Omnitrophota bacterium]